MTKTMSKPWAFISPASRGIGLHFARRLLKTTDCPVIATARKDLSKVNDQILEGLAVDKQRLEVLHLDVTGIPTEIPSLLSNLSPRIDETTIAAASAHCGSRFPPSSNHLHLAFLIPGMLHPEKSPAQIDASKALETFRLNTLGPLLLTKHFSGFLPRKSASLSPSPGLPSSAVLALMSARVGSITDNALGGWYSYRASKAGVNQVAKSVDIYLRQRCGANAMCVALHPGTVKTGLSKDFWGGVSEEKLFSPGFAAERLCEVVGSVGVEGRGKCWDWEGKEIPP